jgi:hypothetical protein
MYPHERSLVEKFAGKPFAIIGVNSDPDLEKLKPRLVEEKITWRSFTCGPQGPRGPIPVRWNVTGWPTVFVIDHLGLIRHCDPAEDELDGILTALVEKAAAGKQ